MSVRQIRPPVHSRIDGWVGVQIDLSLSFFVGFYEPGRGLYVDDLRLIAKCRLGVTVGRLEAL